MNSPDLVQSDSRLKRWRVLTEDEDESAGEEQIKAPKRKRRRDLDSPPASPSAPNEPVSSSPIRSEEAIKFENAIVRGSWANVFYRFGGALVRSGGSLLDGVNLDLYDSRGMTSLHSAAAIGDAELTVLLLKRGAKHQLATLSGWTTWHIATGHIDVLHAMLDFLRPKMS